MAQRNKPPSSRSATSIPVHLLRVSHASVSLPCSEESLTDTGGGSGIGRAIALALAGAGAAVAVNYAASKGAIHTMTKSLARALAPRITVNAIAPGLIDTPRHRGREEQNARIIQSLPAKRIGRPDEIAHIALSLMTAGGYVTGQIIVVDGGMLL